MKFKTYKGQTLYDAVVTRKIDGVRAVYDGEQWLSRAGKPLHNLPRMEPGTYEVFTGSFSDTISAVRTLGASRVEQWHLYRLFPECTLRLYINHYRELTSDVVDRLFATEKKKGHEGLVILSGGVYYKVKDVATYDVPVIGIQPGGGKHTGRMGALITPMGKVGTGFTDAERVELMNIPIFSVIEVAAMELTEDGKFRHPRFIRVREDKIWGEHVRD